MPLDETGLAMAAAFADYYAGQSWDAVYASPLLRARQTAQPLASRLSLSVTIESGLREIAYGSWDGMLEAEVESRYPAEFKAWSGDPGRHSPPGGETAHDIAARALPVVQAIRERHPSGNVLVVSHKATIRILVCALLGIDIALFRARVAQRVGAVTAFEFAGSGPRLITLSDISHLPLELREDIGS